jgi:ligand-binding sensor domain-containing protein/signal transduction histidine kinase
MMMPQFESDAGQYAIRSRFGLAGLLHKGCRTPTERINMSAAQRRTLSSKMVSLTRIDQMNSRHLPPLYHLGLRRCGGLLLLVIILALPVCAQQNDLFFDTLTYQAQDLLQGQVQAILQDHSGFMWFGIQNGLVRYDGQTMTVYRHDPDDQRSLSDSNVLSLCEDHDGNIWVGTHIGGLNRFDQATGTFTRFQPDGSKSASLGKGAIWTIHEDRAGTLWIGLAGGGLARFEPASESFTHFLPEPQSPRAGINSIFKIYEDSPGNLWLGTGGGLLRFDRDNNRFTLFKSDAQKQDFISTIYEDRNGTLWIGSSGGLLRFDRNTGHFTGFVHDARKQDSLSSNIVTAIEEDQAGRLWIGTENGLNCFQSQSGRFSRYTNDATTTGSLLDNLVGSLYTDRAGSLWIGSAGGVNLIHRGIERFTRYRFQAQNPKGLSNNNVMQVYEDRAGYIWVATLGGGLNKLNRQSGQFEYFRHDPRNPQSLSSDQVVCVCEDRAGALWVGTRDTGLNLLNPRTGTFTRYRFEAQNPSSLNNDRVNALYEDASGTLWVGTPGGLHQFDRQRQQFIRFLHNDADPHSLSSNRVTAIFEARNGSFWVATDDGGLNLLDRQSGQFTVFKHKPDDASSLSSNAVFSMAEDASGALWVATMGGFNKLDRATGQFTRYTEKNGLASDSVWGILVDRAGLVWMNTYEGVVKFNPETGKFRRYTVRDGLAAETPGQNAHARTRAGELIFGGGQGFTIFNPEQLTDEPPPPPVALTTFKKFDQLVNFERGLAEVGEVKLAPRENFFSFEFAVLDYKEPHRNQYAYKLEGFDPDWIYCGTRRYASYTNLDAGQYVFRVKGANSDSVWNEEGIAIKISVAPPLWKTWWFISMAVLSFCGLAVLFYRYRVSQLKKEYATREAFSRQLIESQESERQRIAAELHDSLGQNLLVIKNRALLGLALSKEDAPKEQFDEITASVSEALNEVRSIAYNLRPLHLERLGLTSTLEEMVETVAEVSGINITSDIVALEGLLSKEGEINLYRIVQECLNNIVKHSRASAASVTIYHDRQVVFLSIEDNGCGFDTQTPVSAGANGRAGHQGLGLSGIAERARILKGSFSIASTPEQGTVVAVEIPANGV